MSMQLPEREQLDLFGEPGQGAPASLGSAPPSDDPPPETSTMASKKKATIAKREMRKKGGGGAPPPDAPDGGSDDGDGHGSDISLQTEARRRYLNYALSVITARALPDVRDGLKPVQRRILFAMLNDEHLRPENKYRKSAKVVGTVIGRYHPHGDTAVYDTLVRMAQPFSLRYPLVDGQGNFGSVDGDPPAAMRYTECRMDRIAGELLADIEMETVDFTPN